MTVPAPEIEAVFLERLRLAVGSQTGSGAAADIEHPPGGTTSKAILRSPTRGSSPTSFFAGADRIGTSNSVKLVTGRTAEGGY